MKKPIPSKRRVCKFCKRKRQGFDCEGLFICSDCFNHRGGVDRSVR